MADPINRRLKSLDAEVKDRETELKAAEEKLSNNPSNTSLLAERNRLVEDIADLKARRSKLEDRLSGLFALRLRARELRSTTEVQTPTWCVLCHLFLIMRCAAQLLTVLLFSCMDRARAPGLPTAAAWAPRGGPHRPTKRGHPAAHRPAPELPAAGGEHQGSSTGSLRGREADARPVNRGAAQGTGTWVCARHSARAMARQ